MSSLRARIDETGLFGTDRNSSAVRRRVARQDSPGRQPHLHTKDPSAPRSRYLETVGTVHAGTCPQRQRDRCGFEVGKIGEVIAFDVK